MLDENVTIQARYPTNVNLLHQININVKETQFHLAVTKTTHPHLAKSQMKKKVKKAYYLDSFDGISVHLLLPTIPMIKDWLKTLTPYPQGQQNRHNSVIST